MHNVERLARTVAEQRTGDGDQWDSFVPEVEAAIEKAKENPSLSPRDFLDEPERLITGDSSTWGISDR